MKIVVRLGGWVCAAILALGVGASSALSKISACEGVQSGAARDHSDSNVKVTISKDQTSVTIKHKCGNYIKLKASDLSVVMHNLYNANTGVIYSAPLKGKLVAAVAINHRTEKVAVALHAKYLALTNWSFVIVVDSKTGNQSLAQLPLNGIVPPSGDTGNFHDIEDMKYDAMGRLKVLESDGVSSFVLTQFNPDLSFYKCEMLESGHGNVDYCAARY